MIKVRQIHVLTVSFKMKNLRGILFDNTYNITCHCFNLGKINANLRKKKRKTKIILIYIVT